MICPVDGTVLTLADRSGIEIDYCPDCRGVWLDRGELEKLIERSAPPSRSGRSERDDDRRHRDWDDDDDGRRRGSDRSESRRRRGMLGEIFDF